MTKSPFSCEILELSVKIFFVVAFELTELSLRLTSVGSDAHEAWMTLHTSFELYTE